MRSNVYCTNCSRNFICTLDTALDGNHIIECPFCHHLHYRVIRAGEVTEDRYQSSAGPTFYATTSTTISTQYQGTNSIISASWLNRGDLDIQY